MAKVYLLFGGNIGDVRGNFRKAVDELKQHGFTITACSSLYLTSPWGEHRQDPFLNMCVAGTTLMEPAELMSLLLDIERLAGRKREKNNAPRTLDLDMLFYDDLILQSPEVIVPHPRLHLRNFTLNPLAEVAPDLVHPVLKKTVRELVAGSPDSGEVSKLEKAEICTDDKNMFR